MAEVASGPTAAGAARLYERAGERRSSGDFDEAIKLLAEAVRLDSGNLEYRSTLAETLGWAKRFAEAEKVYRDAMARFGPTRELRLGLARVILWQTRYGDAAEQFDLLLAENERDAEALEGRAQAAYWSGDVRGAETLFRKLLLVEPGNAEAAKTLSDIRTASQPAYRAGFIAVDDSQPYQWTRPEFRASFFSDPVTRWDIFGAAYLLDGGRASAETLGLGVSSRVPAWRAGFDLAARAVQFADGETEVLGDVRLWRSFGAHSTISVQWQETELFATATAVDDHAWMSTASLRWELFSTWSAAASMRRHEYSDDNEGSSGDAWALFPVFKRPRVTMSAGPAVAYRDVTEPRFRFVSARGEPLGFGFRYRYRGEYDPYWTPHQLREARLTVALEVAAPAQARLKVQLDGGIARDRAVAFGPLEGAGPSPPFTFEVMFEREYHPWRAGAELSVPLNQFQFTVAYRHSATVYYRSNEIEAALARRF